MALSLRSGVAAMKFLSTLGHAGQLDSLGISSSDYARFTGDEPWLGSDRNRMTNILHSLLLGTVDAMGLPRFDISAELIAAGIAVFVAGVNCQAASIFAPSSGEAESLMRGVQSPPVKPSQIFALVVDLKGDLQCGQARILYEKNIGVAVEKAMMEGQKKNGSVSHAR